jgi:hypothetical protein
LVLGTARGLSVTVLACRFTSPLLLEHMKLRLNARCENPWVDGEPELETEFVGTQTLRVARA